MNFNDVIFIIALVGIYFTGFASGITIKNKPKSKRPPPPIGQNCKCPGCTMIVGYQPCHNQAPLKDISEEPDLNIKAPNLTYPKTKVMPCGHHDIGCTENSCNDG